MKLLMCGNCEAIFNLGTHVKSCSCGQTIGAYDEDRYHAWFEGDEAMPLGFQNLSFGWAMARQPERGAGRSFEAFVIPKECSTFRRGRQKDA